MLSGLRTIYRWCLLLLTSVAAGIIFCILVLILVDVSMRSFGAQPPRLTSGLIEYGLLYATMFAAPWLLYKRGHVAVGSFVSLIPDPARRLIVRASLLVCFVAGCVFTFYATKLLIAEIGYGAYDIRSIRIPRFLLYAPLPLGFGLMTIEFAIRLFGGGNNDINEVEASSEGV